MSPTPISVTLPPDVADIVGRGINRGGNEDIAFALRLIGQRAEARKAGDHAGVRRVERRLVTTFSKEL